MQYKWIIQEVQQERIIVNFVGIGLIKADGLIKPLQRTKHMEFIKQLGLVTLLVGL